MKTIKVSEASGAVLDWMVAQCEGWPLTWDENSEDFFLGLWAPLCFLKEFNPSTDWAQGGPIKERESIRTQRTFNSGKPNTGFDAFKADIDFVDEVMTLGEFTQYGETELIAAMRCYVASKLGDAVEVPEELCK